MLWSAVLAGVCGAIAAGVASLIVRDSESKRTAHTVLTVVLFLGLNLAARTYLLPEIRASEARQQADEIFAENRLFALLGSRHPEIKQEFTRIMIELVRQGASQESANAAGMEWGRKLVGPYFNRYAPTASSESLRHFVTVIVGVLEELRDREDGSCHFWMFGGQAPPGFSISDAFSQRDQEAMLDAMADVIESSIASTQDPPDARLAQESLEHLGQKLLETHGEEFVASLALLESPNAADVDRRAICNAATELYRAALTLPENEQATLFPFLFSDAQ